MTTPRVSESKKKKQNKIREKKENNVERGIRKVIFERPTDGAPAAHRRHSKSSARRANINFLFYSRDGLRQKGRIARSLHFDVFYDPLINTDAQ